MNGCPHPFLLFSLRPSNFSHLSHPFIFLYLRHNTSFILSIQYISCSQYLFLHPRFPPTFPAPYHLTSASFLILRFLLFLLHFLLLLYRSLPRCIFYFSFSLLFFFCNVSWPSKHSTPTSCIYPLLPFQWYILSVTASHSPDISRCTR